MDNIRCRGPERGGLLWSGGYYGTLAPSGTRQHVFTIPSDALHLGVYANDRSGRPALTVDVLTVAALVVLAGRLPGHPKVVGDLWPADAQPDSLVDERR